MSPGGLIYECVARGKRPEHKRDTPIQPSAWLLGILTDNEGHVHVGAVLAGQGGEPCGYVDLLAPVGSAIAAQTDLTGLFVLDSAQHVAELQHIVERSIDDNRLRDRLIELTHLSACHQ